MATLLASSGAAQEACPCVPVTKLWTASVCENWNCASSALVTANGSPSVFAIPVGMNDPRWLVIRNAPSGAYSDDSPYQVDSFDGVNGAIARFVSLSANYHPMILSAPDGRLLVLSLRTPDPGTGGLRRRAAGR